MSELDYDKAQYGERWAAVYDDEFGGEWPDAIEFLAGRAGRGPVLEFAIGTGRMALPLIERGLKVDGVDTSAAMVERLHKRNAAVRVEIGDMATVSMGREYPLVFLVFNSLFLLREQDEQVRCFENAARHLTRRGAFVVHAFVPDLNRFVDGQAVRASDVSDTGVSIEAARHHLSTQRLDIQYLSVGDDGKVELYPIKLRYAWPAELDLMARLAGLRLVERFGGWRGEPFSDSSAEHVSVYRRA